MEGGTYEGYVAHMRPYAERLARKRCARHPYLEKEDLVQEAMVALCQLWQKNHRRLPYDDLCRIGHLAMLRQMQDSRDRAIAFGQESVVWVDLDQGQVPNRADSLEALFLLLGLQEVSSVLSDAGRAVLQEVLAPGAKTLREVRRLWMARRNGVRWPEVQALSAGLRMTIPAVRMALREVRHAVAKIFHYVHCHGNRYTKAERPVVSHKEGVMGHKKEILPEAPDPVALGDLEQVPPASAEPAKKQSRAVKVQSQKKEEEKMATATKTKGKIAEKKAVANGSRPGTIRAFVQEHFSKGSTMEAAAKALAKAFPKTSNPEGSVKAIVSWVKSNKIFNVEENKNGSIKFVKRK